MKNLMLIVEDLEVNRVILRELFQDRFRIAETETAEEGLEFLKNHAEGVGVILLDLMFPGMSGVEFLEEKSKDERISKIPVLVITGSDSVDDQVTCLNLGVNEFITKPFSPEVVTARVNNVLFHNHQMRMVEAEIANLKLKAETDEMTGLSNKVSTETNIDEVLKQNDGTLDVLLVIDIDYFKTVNDTLGHQVGDKVIKIIANIISGLVRKSDIVGRVGGDEFCALMKDVPNMEVVYSKLRELCQIMKYKPHIPIPEYVTLSIGVASNERKSTTYHNLFSKADEALFQVKQSGRGHFREYGVEPEIVEEEISESMLQEKSLRKKENLVLVVDDDPITRKIFRKILSEDYELIEAENGMDAIRQIRNNESRLMMVILDLSMPIMNGYQVLEMMKRSHSLKNIPVIISTAETSDESDLRSLNLGANLVTHKPINAGLLKKQIENQVEAYRERKKEVQQYALQKSLIGNRTNTFLCTYRFDTNKAEIGESYLKYVSPDFPNVFSKYPFQIENFVLPVDRERAKKFFEVKKEKKQHDEIELRIRVGNSQYEWFEINKVVTRDEDENVDCVVFMFLHIEYAVEAKQNLAFLASNDSLTHIPNMYSFTDTVANMLALHPNEKFAMISMDIFQFRVVNKLFGHKAADSVIKYIATRIQEMVEDIGLGAYCRSSADVFYICISQKENIAEFMQLVQQAVSRYPIKYQIKVCFGIYMIEDRTESVENMIEHSTFARKAAKTAPVKTFQYYNSELQKKETFETVATTEMEEGLRNQQFEVYFQPKCDTRTEKIVGAEALIRWNHPEEGYLSPAYFIPVFEQNGTCVELDYFVYEQICMIIRGWMDQGKDVVPISVNVSRWSLYNADLEKNICEIVEKYRIPHEYIEFEITESAFVLETDLLVSFSKSMREKGFHILIDDFGSGYSSLNSLKDISVDVLKIDIKFLPIDKKEDKAEIVLSAVINMGRSLGLDIIAEGVETKEQLEMLKSLGCKCVQGYYFYKPMPYLDFQKVVFEKQ